MSQNLKVPLIFPLGLVLSFLVLFLRLLSLQVMAGAELAQRAEQNRLKILALPAPRGVIYDRHDQVLARNTPQGREYPLGAAAAHIVGYLGEATQDELETFTVSLGATLGKMGVEREEDKLLRGIDGGIIVETAANGQAIRELSRKEAIPGQDLHLFLDSRLQKTASEILNHQPGAIVVTTPKGEVLALASSPAFDPNIFSDRKGDKEDQINQALTDEDQPLFDRAIGGQYPPGSVFKIVTATAGLETQVISANEEIEDTGEIRVGRFRYGNWYFDQYGKKEGMVNLRKAFQRSNDIYFYKVGEKLGITKLAAWAKAFGLGEISGIPLSGEASGLVPDSQWKEKTKGESWYLGDTYITAIGQGDLQATPLQVNQMTAVIANGGQKCRPKIVNDGLSPKCQDLPISAANIAAVKEGMKQACEPGGTGWPLFEFKIKDQKSKIKIDEMNYFKDASDSARQNSSGNLDGQAEVVRIPVACKTGTSEFGDPKGRTHAWFTVFAPVNQPQIVVTVLLEAAGQGSDQAAPLAKEILKTWFEE